jgi:hypothetical protein
MLHFADAEFGVNVGRGRLGEGGAVTLGAEGGVVLPFGGGFVAGLFRPAGRFPSGEPGAASLVQALQQVRQRRHRPVDSA